MVEETLTILNYSLNTGESYFRPSEVSEDVFNMFFGPPLFGGKSGYDTEGPNEFPDDERTLTWDKSKVSYDAPAVMVSSEEKGRTLLYRIKATFRDGDVTCYTRLVPDQNPFHAPTNRFEIEINTNGDEVLERKVREWFEELDKKYPGAEEEIMYGPI